MTARGGDDTSFYRIYSHSLAAARDAVNMHEGELEFDDALRTAAGLYTAGWLESQRRQGRNPVPCEQFPTAASRDLFRYNHNLQSVLMERDPFLCTADAYVRGVLEEVGQTPSSTVFTFRRLLFRYLDFAKSYTPAGTPPFYAQLDMPVAPCQESALRYRRQKITFPSRRAWAAFLALNSLWAATPWPPRCTAKQLYSGHKLRVPVPCAGNG